MLQHLIASKISENTKFCALASRTLLYLALGHVSAA